MRNTKTDIEGVPQSRVLSLAGHVVATRWRHLMDSHGLPPHGLAVLAYLEQGQALTQRERLVAVGSPLLHSTIRSATSSSGGGSSGVATRPTPVRRGLTDSGYRHLGAVQQPALDRMEAMLDHLDPAAEEAIVRRFLAVTVARIQSS